MIAIAVDDEKWALDDLSSMLQAQSDIAKVQPFATPDEALAWARVNPFDIAFLDVNMRGMNGVELAKSLREINSKSYIIFCTGYDDYSMDAIKMHANAYITKPILPENLKAELDYIKSRDEAPWLLTLRVYGGFDVYDSKDRPLNFKRKRAKELLAFLYNQKGMGISSKELCSQFFEDGECNQKNLNYLYKLMQELNRALTEAGAGDIVKKVGQNYYLEMSRVKVDESDKEKGEYLKGYAWA